MKIRSLPDRDKSHKRVKDISDLHALLWYVKDYAQMKTITLEHVSDADLERLEEAIDETIYQSAAQLLQIEQKLIKGSIERLLQ